MAARLEEFLGETRSRILRILRRGPSTVGDLAERLEISGNAVRSHLSSLQSDGLVRSPGTAPSTGGKPARLYDLAPTAEELFPKAYPLVLEGLIDALERRDGRERTIDLLREVGSTLAREAEAGSAPATDTGVAEDPDAEASRRVLIAAGLLEAIGGDVRIEETAEGWEIRGYGCPLSSVVVDRPDACILAQGLIEEITGRTVEERCDRGERPRCGFCVARAVS